MAPTRIGLLCILFAIAVPPPALAGLEPDQRDVEHAVTEFLTAFENLDMPRFIRCFAEDATVFFPTPEPPERFDGKAAIQAHFQQVFDAIRKDAHGGPPYHRLVPANLDIKVLSADVAVVTFQIRNASRLARRTLVLHRVRGSWLITHLHASNVSLS